MFGGIFALVIGLVLILAHNHWVQSWEVIITALGWLALIKGILLLWAPEEMGKMTEKMMKGKGTLVVGGVIALVFGVVLGYFGWYL